MVYVLIIRTNLVLRSVPNLSYPTLTLSTPTATHHIFVSARMLLNRVTAWLCAVWAVHERLPFTVSLISALHNIVCATRKYYVKIIKRFPFSLDTNCLPIILDLCPAHKKKVEIAYRFTPAYEHTHTLTPSPRQETHQILYIIDLFIK